MYVEFICRNLIGEPLLIGDLSFDTVILFDLADECRIPQVTKVNSNFQQQKHSQVQRIRPFHINADVCSDPPDKQKQQTVGNQQDEVKFGDRAEIINILLILRGQFKTAFKLKMTDLTEAVCAVEGQIVIARVKNDPENN